MAQTAQTEMADNVAELSKRTTEHAVEGTHQAVDKTENVARRGAQVAQRAVAAVGEVERTVTHRSAEGTAELGQALVDLVNAQTQHNLETWSALAQAVDWDQAAKAVDWERVVQIQSDYLRVSFERAAQLLQRYVEVAQAVTVATADVAKRQARKAA
jgi:hypothetical protein